MNRKFSICVVALLMQLIVLGSNKQVDSLHEQAYALFSVDYDSSMRVADIALELSKRENYHWGEANSYFIKGYLYGKKKEHATALLMYLKASYILDELQTVEAQKKNMDILLNGGSILRKHYKYKESLEFYDKALHLPAADGFPKRRLKLLYNKASTLQDKGDLEGALESVGLAIELAKELEDYSRLLKCWNLFGIISKDNENFDIARNYYWKILLHPESGHRTNAKAYHNLAVTYLLENQLDSAEMYYESALVLKRDLNNDELLFSTLSDLSELYKMNGKWDAALRFAQEAEKSYAGVVVQPETFRIFHILDTVHYVKKDFEKSQHYSSIYFAESVRFYDSQKELIKLKDKFQMDLMLAGFYKEIRANKTSGALRTWILIILSVSALVIGLMRVRKVLTRKAIERELIKLKIVSNPDTP